MPPSRALKFTVFDVDNHMYETPDAFTKYLPAEYRGLISYVEVNGRTKIAIKGQISEYIPNPTFDVVAPPGAWEDYFRNGNPEGKTLRELFDRPIRAVPAYRNPEARVALMDELGLDHALMWPTLASLLEERLRDDPDATHVVIHAFNQWMHEHWTFNYENRIFPTPVVSLPIVEKAIEELEWVAERGARVVLIRPAPVPGLRGPRSMALPEFDPFWERVVETGMVIGMHASDSGYQRYTNEWEGIRGEFEPFQTRSAFSSIAAHQREGRAISDMVASLIGHGLCTRFPTLKFLPVETGSSWVAPLVKNLGYSYAHAPNLYDEDPVEVFNRNIWVHPFHEDNSIGLIELLGADRVLFGSDFPHPEGLVDPITYVDDLQGLPEADIAKVMGGNLAALVGV
jgi:predicted TIM-barrel fold metal-dependent hydrolase